MRRVREDAKRVDIARVMGRARRSRPRLTRLALRAASSQNVDPARCGASTVIARSRIASPTTPSGSAYSLKR